MTNDDAVEQARANRDETIAPPPPSPSPSSSPLTILLNYPHVAPPHPIIDHKRMDAEFLVHFVNTWFGDGSYASDDDCGAISFCIADARLASTLYHRYRVLRSITVRDLLHFWRRRFDRADERFVPLFANVRGSMREWSSLATPCTAWAIPRIADRQVWYLRIHRACKMPHELTITSLSIRQGIFFVGTFKFLAHCLETFPSLTKLHLNETCDTRPPEGEAQEDGTHADGFGGFDSLFLSDNGGHDDDDKVPVNGGWSSHFSLLPVPQLTELELGIYNDAAGWSAIGITLQHVPQLTSLSLGHSHMDYTGCQHLAPFLRHVPQLLTLDLSWNKIGDEGCRALAASLHHIPQLTSLKLYCNKIGDDGCLALVASLQHVPRLAELRLCGNWIGDEGCGALEPFETRMQIDC